jgi:hypothetical protein
MLDRYKRLFVVWNVPHACMPVERGSTCQPCSALSSGTGIVRRFLGSLAPRHDLQQHSAHHDIMCVVTGDTRGGAIARAGAPRGYVFTWNN